jgi:hypothetical protein
MSEDSHPTSEIKRRMHMQKHWKTTVAAGGFLANRRASLSHMFSTLGRERT